MDTMKVDLTSGSRLKDVEVQDKEPDQLKKEQSTMAGSPAEQETQLRKYTGNNHTKLGQQEYLPPLRHVDVLEQTPISSDNMNSKELQTAGRSTDADTNRTEHVEKLEEADLNGTNKEKQQYLDQDSDEEASACKIMREETTCTNNGKDSSQPTQSKDNSYNIQDASNPQHTRAEKKRKLRGTDLNNPEGKKGYRTFRKIRYGQMMSIRLSRASSNT